MAETIHAHNHDLQLIAATVHELKTPLTLIKGMSSMLESETFGELNFKQREQIRHITKASHRLGFLVESLLHVENLPYTQQKQPVQLQSELQLAIASLAEKAAEREIAIRYRPKRISPVLADPLSVYQVLMHLLGMSVKHAPEGSTISVTTRKKKGSMSVQIADESPGIATKEARKIKESFGVRRQPVRAHADSSGLSLYVIKSIVEFYGGELSVSSTKHGSSVAVSLPLSNQLSLFESEVNYDGAHAQ